MIEIRRAEPADLALVTDIEQRAEAPFRAAGFPPFPDHPREHASWLVLVAGKPPAGFARLVELDGQAHLDELDVLPERMREGIGTALIEAACAAAARRGYCRITLTTFRDVAWNAPFYRNRGFVELPAPGPQLVAERAAERAAGLDEMGPRIAMVRQLASG